MYFASRQGDKFSTNRRALGIFVSAVAVILAVSFYMAWPRTTPPIDTGKTPPHKADQRPSDGQQQQKVAEIVASGDLARCESVKGLVIGGVDYYTVCRDNISFNRAREQLDLSSCDNLGGGFAAVADCQRLVIAERAGQAESSAICDNVPSSLMIFCQSSYWTAEALRRSDVNVCEEIAEENAALLCRQSVLVARLSIEPSKVDCGLFSKGAEKDCRNFKRAISNRGDCGTIIDARLRLACGEATSAP